MDRRRAAKRFHHAATVPGLLLAFVLCSPDLGAAPSSSPRRETQSATGFSRPDVVLITIDTLRYDRLSVHGYERPTSPYIDALIEKSVRFDQARVVEPLTAPSMISMITSRHPHQHATSRNGLRMRPKMLSLSKILMSRGYRTTAFVGNWTLRDQLTGLADHFDEYHEVLTRKRWFGLFKGEATAEDLTGEAIDWLEERLDDRRRTPYLLWVHYVEPHAPYRLHREFLDQLRIPERDSYSPSERYDTEVAFVDRAVGRLLEAVEKAPGPRGTVIVLLSDHGESLGEHGYWGHGRHAYDVTLRIPMSFAWEGRIEPGRVETTASSLDVAPTILGLMGLPSPDQFEGCDQSAVLRGEAEPAAGRTTFHQAHKGVRKGQPAAARQKGLLELALVGSGTKETLRVKSGVRRVFDLLEDPYETLDRAQGSEVSPELEEWLRKVHNGLVEADLLPTTPLDEESLERMRALGYVE